MYILVCRVTVVFQLKSFVMNSIPGGTSPGTSSQAELRREGAQDSLAVPTELRREYFNTTRTPRASWVTFKFEIILQHIHSHSPTPTHTYTNTTHG